MLGFSIFNLALFPVLFPGILFATPHLPGKWSSVEQSVEFSLSIRVFAVRLRLIGVTDAHDGLAADAVLPSQRSNGLTLSQTRHHSLDRSVAKALWSTERFALRFGSC